MTFHATRHSGGDSGHEEARCRRQGPQLPVDGRVAAARTGAYVLGNGRPAVSPHQRPVPIASVAKVMAAYLVLKH